MPIVPNDIFLLISKAFFSKIDNNFTIFLPLPLINSDLREKEETYLIERERERERERENSIISWWKKEGSRSTVYSHFNDQDFRRGIGEKR